MFFCFYWLITNVLSNFVYLLLYLIILQNIYSRVNSQAKSWRNVFWCYNHFTLIHPKANFLKNSEFLPFIGATMLHNKNINIYTLVLFSNKLFAKITHTHIYIGVCVCDRFHRTSYYNSKSTLVQTLLSVIRIILKWHKIMISIS